MSKSDTDRFKDMIGAIRDEGEHNERRGSLEIGSVPGKEGSVLHILFDPADDKLIGEAEEGLGREVPDVYKTFLKVTNGLYLYDGALQLDGAIPDNPKVQPPDLLEVNVRERPEGATDELFFFGFYDWDGTLLYADGDGRVFRTDRDKVDPKNEWDSIPDAIHSEWTRLHELFSDGFDDDLKTVPE